MSTDVATDYLTAITSAIFTYCTYCDFFRYNSDDLRKGCPGHPTSNANKPPKATFAGII